MWSSQTAATSRRQERIPYQGDVGAQGQSPSTTGATKSKAKRSAIPTGGKDKKVKPSKMKKQIKNLILFLILAFSSNASFAYVLTPDELKNDLNKKINSQIKEQLKNYSSDFKIKITGVPIENIITQENNKPKIEIISQNNNFNQNQYRRILIKSQNGTTIKAFPITVQTLVYKDVLVANETIAYNQEINQANTKLERKEISRLLDKTISKNNINLIATRNYPKGSIINSQFVKSKSIVAKNSMIDIVFQTKGMNIKLKGTALKEGSIGDTILVRSEKYNKTYNGVVLSQNEVMVRI